MARRHQSGKQALADSEAAQPGVLDAAIEAIRKWLSLNTSVILSGGASAPPDLSAWLPDSRWIAQVASHILPALRNVYEAQWGASGTVVAIDRSISAYLDEVTNRLKNFADESFDIVRTALQDGIAAGDGTRGLRDRVGRALKWDAFTRDAQAQIDSLAATIDNPDTSPEDKKAAKAKRRELYDTKDASLHQWEWRAESIARTEALGAFNSGLYAGTLAQAEVHGDPLSIQWWSTRDTRTRRTHRAVHGEIRPIGEPFHVGTGYLFYPHDITGPPDEVINCRCVAIEVDLA